MLSQDLLTKIRLVAIEHPNRVGLIVKELEKANSEQYERKLVISILNQILNKAFSEQAAEMFDVWQKEPFVSSKEIATALATAQHCHITHQKELSIELVWSGPNLPSSTMRRTDQALLELIGQAKEELTIVSFVVYKIPELIEALNEAVKRSVRVRIIAETKESSGGKVSFDLSALGKDLLEKIDVLVWPLGERPTNASGEYGSLHTKCAVADRKWLFISSANLTEHALTLNMEMGLLIHNGGLAGQVTEHINNLVLNGILSIEEDNKLD